MIPKFQWRRIGGVNIFELQGVFTQPWLKRHQEEMDEVLNQYPSRGLLFNLRQVDRVDHSGADIILDTARKASRGCILGQNLSSFFVAEHMKPNQTIPIFEKEKEAIEYFGKEFALTDNSPTPEKRLFPRLETALPLELSLQDAGSTFFFEAVALNLSEGGLYAHFLDSGTDELAKRVLDPFDLKMLALRLGLQKNKILKMDGKILRREDRSWNHGAGAVALEFYNLQPENQREIREFLEHSSTE